MALRRVEVRGRKIRLRLRFRLEGRGSRFEVREERLEAGRKAEPSGEG
jgi:hypothetical protein